MDPSNPANPGETPASPTGNGGVDPSAPTNPAPNGSEPDTNPGGQGEPAMVPSDRLREETSKRREAEERAQRLEQELAARNVEPDPDPDPDGGEDEDIDPDVEKLVTKVIQKQGYVKQEDLQKREMARQYEQDVQSLTSKYADTSVPFVAEDVRKYAKENGISITSKASLEAAYRDMNFDKIVEAQKNAAITSFKEKGEHNAGEKPGGSDGKPHDQQPEVRGLKNRVHAALQKSKA